MLRAGQAVAVPIPRASVALTAKIDLVSVTGSAAGRSAELFGMEIGEQLPSPMAATDGYHYFAAALLGECVEAPEHHGVIVNDDDFLVGDVDLNHVGDDGTQLVEGFGEVWLSHEGVTRIPYEDSDPHAAVDRRAE